MNCEHCWVESVRQVRQIEMRDRVGCDEHDLPTFATPDISVRGRGLSPEEADMVLFAIFGARQDVSAQQLKVVVGQPRFFGKFADSRVEGRFVRFDTAAQEPPLLRVDRRVLVPLLHEQPSTLVNEPDECNLMHVATLAATGVDAPLLTVTGSLPYFARAT
jgi:hypothetical protein